MAGFWLHPALGFILIVALCLRTVSRVLPLAWVRECGRLMCVRNALRRMSFEGREDPAEGGLSPCFHAPGWMFFALR
jgi:hypothetical protein